MGSGQSKFYRNSNKNQYPYGAPPPPIYPGQYNQPFAPQYAGYGQMYPPQQMPGFIPPGAFVPGNGQPPTTLLHWNPQDRRKSRRSRRRESERFVGGFAQERQPEPVSRRESERDRFVGGLTGGQQPEAPRRARSESRRRESEPVIPPVVPPMVPQTRARHDSNSRRAPTPFAPVVSREDSDEDRLRSRPEHIRPVSRQSDLYSPVHSIRGDIDHVLQPLEPPRPSMFGPPGNGPNAPIGSSNPLPPPPRDIYDMSPYKSVLTLPQTTALLTASYGPHLARVNTSGQQPTVERKKSVAKGLLRAFSKREKKPEQPQVHFVPVFVPPKDQNQSHSQGSSSQHANTTHANVIHNYPTATAQQAADLIRSISQQHRPPFVNNPVQVNMMHAPTLTMPSDLRRAASVAQSTHSADAMFPPVPPMPTSPPAVRFDQDSPYNIFMNHSPHRVLYGGVTYPTASHLFEAFKFIDLRPDVAEKIRMCPDVHALYDLTNQYAEFIRPDWATVHLDFMREVLYLKFRQHADLRSKLLATGDARIIYADSHDTFWGVGSDESGTNHLGKALVKVRDRLRMENLSTMS